MSTVTITNQHARHVQVGATKTLFDDIIDRHAEAYLAAYPEVKEFSNFEKSGTINYYIGMIWTSDYEKPDTQQLRIRGSQSLAKNKMLELDLSAIDSQQVFIPGQIIAFSADPFLKRQLNVRKILDPMRIAPPLKRINMDEKICLAVASGPFMKPEQEDWSLYDKLIESIISNGVTHAVLLGPFVDMENKQFRGKYDSNWKILFDKLAEGLFNHPCKVYLIPSNRDVLPHHLSSAYFYPTPGLSFNVKLKQNAEPKCNIVSVSDPSQIDLGGLYLDVTSAEVLFHLNKCISFHNKGLGNMFNPMYRHILTHGIYPIYPPPSDIAVDYPKLLKHLQLDRLAPHIVVLPTKFNTSVNNVENRLFITVQKCSTKKHMVLVDIPKIESSDEAPIDSVVITDYKSKVVDLFPHDE